MLRGDLGDPPADRRASWSWKATDGARGASVGRLAHPATSTQASTSRPDAAKKRRNPPASRAGAAQPAFRASSQAALFKRASMAAMSRFSERPMIPSAGGCNWPSRWCARLSRRCSRPSAPSSMTWKLRWLGMSNPISPNSTPCCARPADPVRTVFAMTMTALDLCRRLKILTDSRQATGETLAILRLIAGPSVEGAQKRRPSLRP